MKHALKVSFMQEIDDYDRYDLRLLAALQGDGSLTNQQLADKVHLSPSQCSRRRARLEADGTITGYRAELAAGRLGFAITAFINVTLATHGPDNSRRFTSMIAGLGAVQEAHALTGDMDYLLKVAVADLAGLAELINDHILPHDTVDRVRSSIALETLKADNRFPIVVV